jgi:hypothetical protein
VPVSVTQMRAALLPGLRMYRSTYTVPAQWERVFNFSDAEMITLDDPHYVPPSVGVRTAIVMGAAAAVMKNPVVSRRWWKFWDVPRTD